MSSANTNGMSELVFVDCGHTNNTDGLISMDADLSVAIVCLFVLVFCLFRFVSFRFDLAI